MDGTATDRRRADAARNRAALLEAGFHVFAERGVDAPLDAVARRARLGSATLYRHFPSRADLLEAVVAGRMSLYAEAAEAGLAADDPWEGFRAFVSRILDLQVDDHVLAELRATVTSATGEVERQHRRAFEATARLLQRAKAAGRLRADFEHQDIAILVMAHAGLVARTGRHAPESRGRLLAFLLDGLRAEAATPAPPPPSEADLRELAAGSACGSLN